ncbi:MAG: DUF1552 domain-containing protein [Proteobacteria bacterium]|nr:MAG: DUF1552 domain-containing protein [Pseudomonadota bacterium]
MSSMKVSRRTFTRYASHSMIGAALMRTFAETQAFGQEGMLKLMICTSPNGHFDTATTRGVFQANMDAAVFNKYVLSLDKFNSAQTFSTSSSVGDWHGAQGGLLSFRDGKGDGASFFASLNNLKKVHMSVEVSQALARDSAGGILPTLQDPAAAMRSIFGNNFINVNSTDLALIEAGKKNILDPNLDDVKAIKKRLGADGVMFDDYIASLQEMYKRFKKVDPVPDPMNPDPTTPDPGTPNKSPSCDRAAMATTGDKKAMHQGMLDVAFQILACDLAQIVTVAYLDNLSEPEHSGVIHSKPTDGGAAFREVLAQTQGRIAKMANKLAAGGSTVLDRTAIMYLSDGGAHNVGGRWDTGHPSQTIPAVIVGKLGGAISKSGTLDCGSATTRQLWRYFADVMGGGKADLGAIGGKDVKPFAV